MEGQTGGRRKDEFRWMNALHLEKKTILKKYKTKVQAQDLNYHQNGETKKRQRRTSRMKNLSYLNLSLAARP